MLRRLTESIPDCRRQEREAQGNTIPGCDNRSRAEKQNRGRAREQSRSRQKAARPRSAQVLLGVFATTMQTRHLTRAIKVRTMRRSLPDTVRQMRFRVVAETRR